MFNSGLTCVDPYQYYYSAERSAYGADQSAYGSSANQSSDHGHWKTVCDSI